MCNMLFIYRMVRFLPASKNIRIIVGTVIDEIRNGEAFFGALFVRGTIHSANLYVWLLLELLLCLFTFWNGIIQWSNRSALRSLQLVECHVRSALLRVVWKNYVCPCRICGTYEQLEYWPNSFDDFYVSDESHILQKSWGEWHHVLILRHPWSLCTTSWLSINGLSLSSPTVRQPALGKSNFLHSTPELSLVVDVGGVNCILLSGIFSWPRLDWISVLPWVAMWVTLERIDSDLRCCSGRFMMPRRNELIKMMN